MDRSQFQDFAREIVILTINFPRLEVNEKGVRLAIERVEALEKKVGKHSCANLELHCALVVLKRMKSGYSELRHLIDDVVRIRSYFNEAIALIPA